ncbi:MAG: hypothetical protein ACOC44_01420 [Promethearchaeia archaeon]
MNNILPKALSQLINFLEKNEKRLGIKYYLVGGILANLYTIFRTTQDVDFVVDLQLVDINIEDYISLLKKNEFKPVQDWASTIKLAHEMDFLQYFDKDNLVKFDNYLIERHDMRTYKKIGLLGMKRRERTTLFSKECWVASKEDFILSKLVFGGWQDYADALGCWLRFKEKLDLSYLDKASKDLDIQKEISILKSGIENPDDFIKKL